MRGATPLGPAVVVGLVCVASTAQGDTASTVTTPRLEVAPAPTELAPRVSALVRVFEQDAHDTRSSRSFAAAVLFPLGAASLGWGLYTIATTEARSSLFLSEYELGWSAAISGVLMFGGGALLLLPSGPEQRYESIERALTGSKQRGTELVDQLRSDIGARAARSASRRRIVRGVGLGLGGAGLAAIGASLVLERSDREHSKPGAILLFGGASAAFWGSMIWLGGRLRSNDQKLDAKLRAAERLSIGVVPSLDGAQLAASGQF